MIKHLLITLDSNDLNLIDLTLDVSTFIRESIANFAIDMEMEMAKKDRKYGTEPMQYSYESLLEHLKSERKEVDEEINLLKENDITQSNFHTELIHEAIMCMLLNNKVKDFGVNNGSRS